MDSGGPWLAALSRKPETILCCKRRFRSWNEAFPKSVVPIGTLTPVMENQSGGTWIMKWKLCVVPQPYTLYPIP